MDKLLHDRRRMLGLTAAGLAAPSLARAAAAAPIGRTLPEAEFTPDDGSTDLVGMEDQLRRMTAPVMIDGKGPFDFMVDTGTNRSVISVELASTLGLAEGKPVRLHGIGGERDAPTVLATRMQVGGREASRVNLPALPQKSLQCDGILGVDGLKNQRVVLDLKNSHLRIEPSSKVGTGLGSQMIKARRRFGQLTVVDTDLDGVQVSVMIDTGSDISVGNSALRKAVGRVRPVDELGLKEVKLVGATGEIFYGEDGGLPNFRIGTLQVRNLRVVFADLHPFKLWELSEKPAMLMGMDLIRYFEVLSLDFSRNELRFDLPREPYVDPAGDTRRRS